MTVIQHTCLSLYMAEGPWPHIPHRPVARSPQRVGHFLPNTVRIAKPRLLRMAIACVVAMVMVVIKYRYMQTYMAVHTTIE